MSINVINQTVSSADNSQAINMRVKSSERGPQGEQGEQGEAATITAGNAYSVPYDSSPAVMNTGTSSAAVFDFYIPQGEKGDSPELKWGTITGTLADQTDLKQALNAKQDKLTAGSNITITGSTISATDTKYTAGTNITITDNTIAATDTKYTAGNGLTLTGTSFSVNTSVVQPKLTAGSNITIDANNEISASVPTVGYSTSEVATGATWIDGKAIYKKTINFGQLPSNTSKSVSHSISNLSRVINIEGYSYSPMYQLNIPLATDNTIATEVNATSVGITTTSDYTDFTESYVTIYYTKTS